MAFTVKKIKIDGTTYTLRDDRIDSLDYTKIIGSGGFINKITQTNGLIEVEELELNKNLSDPTLDDSIAPKTSAVKNYVDSAISSVSKINFVIVDTLPTASASTRSSIYLVAHSHSDTDDTYDEYITVTSDNTTYSWEKIGNTDVSLSGLVTDVTVNPTFTGTSASHKHSLSGKIGDPTYTTQSTWVSNRYVPVYADLSTNYTPAGSVTIDKINGTTASAVSSIKTSSATNIVNSNSSIQGSYTESTETLELKFSPSVSNVITSVTPSTASFVSSVTGGTASFTGKTSAISMTSSLDPSKSTVYFDPLQLDHYHMLDGWYTGPTTIIPTGTVNVGLNVTKHS